MKKATSLLALMLALVMLLSACGPAGEPSGTTPADSTDAPGNSDAADDTDSPDNPDIDENAVVTLALPGGWDSLCPLASTSNNADTAVNTIFENLFEADGKGGYIGRLGESYEIVDDNTALVVHLQKNAVWHDGEPFDADDVIFSARLTTDGSYTTSRRLFFQQMDGCSDSGVELSEDSAHVEKIDDYTVKFYYRQAVSETAMLYPVTAFFIFPEHILKDADPATILENDFWVNPIGTGPFTYESTIPGESLTVAAFDDYYLGKPKFAKLVVKVITSANLVTSMMAGEVDLITGSLAAISDADYDMAAAVDGYTVESVEGVNGHFLCLNNETFNTPKIRKALAMMMDKETMIKAGAGGKGTPAYSMFNGGIYDDKAVSSEYGYEFDPDTAYQMLQEEGFDFDRTYVACINDLPVRQAMMTVMQETWAKYGMKLEIQTLDTQTCIATMREGGCDFWINGTSSADRTFLWTGFLDWVSIDADGNYAPFNLSKISDPKLMELAQGMTSAITEEDLLSVTSEIQKVLLTDYNYIFMITPNINCAVSNRLKGVDKDQMLAMTLNYCDWEVTA